MQSKRWVRKLQDRDYASTFNPELVAREQLCRYRLVPSLKSRGERVAFSFKIREILFGGSHFLHPAVFYSQVG
jgi:hypothetical protein